MIILLVFVVLFVLYLCTSYESFVLQQYDGSFEITVSHHNKTYYLSLHDTKPLLIKQKTSVHIIPVNKHDNKYYIYQKEGNLLKVLGYHKNKLQIHVNFSNKNQVFQIIEPPHVLQPKKTSVLIKTTKYYVYHTNGILHLTEHLTKDCLFELNQLSHVTYENPTYISTIHPSATIGSNEVSGLTTPLLDIWNNMTFIGTKDKDGIYYIIQFHLNHSDTLNKSGTIKIMTLREKSILDEQIMKIDTLTQNHAIGFKGNSFIHVQIIPQRFIPEIIYNGIYAKINYVTKGITKTFCGAHDQNSAGICQNYLEDNSIVLDDHLPIRYKKNFNISSSYYVQDKPENILNDDNRVYFYDLQKNLTPTNIQGKKEISVTDVNDCAEKCFQDTTCDRFFYTTDKKCYMSDTGYKNFHEYKHKEGYGTIMKEPKTTIKDNLQPLFKEFKESFSAPNINDALLKCKKSNEQDYGDPCYQVYYNPYQKIGSFDKMDTPYKYDYIDKISTIDNKWKQYFNEVEQDIDKYNEIKSYDEKDVNKCFETCYHNPNCKALSKECTLYDNISFHPTQESGKKYYVKKDFQPQVAGKHFIQHSKKTIPEQERIYSPHVPQSYSVNNINDCADNCERDKLCFYAIMDTHCHHLVDNHYTMKDNKHATVLEKRGLNGLANHKYKGEPTHTYNTLTLDECKTKGEKVQFNNVTKECKVFGKHATPELYLGRNANQTYIM